MKVTAIDALATVFSLALHGTVFFAKVDASKGLDEAPPLEIALVDPPEEEPPELEKEPETPHEEPAPKDEAPRAPPPVAPKVAPSRSTPTASTSTSEAPANPSTNDAPKADEPVDFFGSGDGAWSLGSGGSGGGSGRGQGPRAVGTMTGAAKPNAPSSPPPANVVRKAALQVDSGCRGFFPEGASDDTATVTIKVLVGKDGQLSDVAVLSEKPPGQGFGAAARSCLKAARGVPALGVDGEAVTAPLTATVRFSR